MYLNVEGQEIRLTNLDRVLWPREGLTKGQLVDYYIRISPQLLKYVMDRPITMVPYPRGIAGPFFYQKNLPPHRPSWLSCTGGRARREKKDMPLIQRLPDLIWVANRNCIEIHPWFSRIDRLPFPDLAVFDLDPSPGVPFSQILQVACLIKEVLQGFSLEGYPKTSGQRGLHIYLPLKRCYSFPQIRRALKNLATMVQDLLPDLVTLKWRKKRRHGVYVDYRQNGQGKTLAAPYSLRPTPMASVSTPLPWSLVEAGGFTPEDFRMGTIWDFIEKEGDPFHPLLQKPQTLPGEIL